MYLPLFIAEALPSLALCLIIIILILGVYIYNLKKKLATEYNTFSKLQSSSDFFIVKYFINTCYSLSFISNNIDCLIGYSSFDFLKKEVIFHDLINTNDLKRLNGTLSSLTVDKQNYSVEYRIRTKEGGEKWVQENGIGIFDKKQRLVAIEAIIKDIHINKLNEIFLNENEIRLENFLENTPLGICTICEDLIAYCNPALVKMMGYSSIKEMVGTSLLNYVTPGNREKLKEIIENLLHGENIREEFETVAICKNGEEKYLQIYFSQLAFEGIIGALVLVQDITFRKQNEKLLNEFNQRLENIIELIPDPTFIIDNSRKVTHWNKAVEELTGVGKLEVLGTDRYSEIFYNKKRPMLVDLAIDDTYITTYYKNLRKENNRLYGEFVGNIINADEEVYLSGVASPLYDNDERLFGAIELVKDISEDKKREAALFESEEKARIILDCSMDSIILVEPDGIIVDCNASAELKLGIKKEELVNTNYLEYLPHCRRIIREMHFNTVIKTGKELIIEEYFTSENEYYLTSIYPVKSKLGEVKRVVISIKNVSKLKQAELQIKLKEEYYRTITENITDYLYKIYYYKKNISVEFESPGVEKIIGYKITELTSSDIVLNKLLISDAQKKAPAVLKSIIKEKKSRTFDHQIVHKSGQLKWLSNSIIYRDPNSDGSYELIGVVKDITLQKHLELALLEAEERYRNVFDHSGMASNVFDLSGKLIMQNLQAAKIMGGVPSDFVGHNIEELYPKEVARYIREVFQETLATGHVNRETEFNVFNNKLWLRTFTHTIKNVQGEIIAIQFISQDITERKEMDKKVLNVILETEEKERMRFAQELHDGVGPLLSAIKIYVQWLGMPQVNVSRSEILADIEKTVNESLLAVKEISYRLNPGNLVKLGLTDALKEFADKINRIGKIKIIVESNLNKRFEVRKETILYRVLCESINNTLKYANATEIKIQLNLNGNRLLIYYTDNGIGFDLNSAGNKGSGINNMKNRLNSIDADVLFKTKPGEGIEMSAGIIV